MDVGLVGLGAMGGGMAASLRRRGHRVHAHDARAGAARAFAAEGGVACASPAEVARACEVLVEGDSWRLIREREKYEDLVRGETV